MPKGKRGKRKRTPVRIKPEVIAVPKGTTRRRLIEVLRESITNPGYSLPTGYVIEIAWTNNRGKTWKSDEWSNALIDSSTYGRGWDGLMSKYLDFLEARL